FKYFMGVGLVKPNAVILYGNTVIFLSFFIKIGRYGTAFHFLGCDLYSWSFEDTAIFDGIGDQVVEKLLQLKGNAPYFRKIAKHKFYLGFPDWGLQVFLYLIQNKVQVYLYKVLFLLADPGIG